MTVPEIVSVFDRVADSYDNVGVEWFRPIARGLVEELAVRPGERVLDLGCGRGAALLPLAEATGPTGQALGLDLAPRMVELANRTVSGLPQARARIGDAGDPQLPAASFEVIASSLVLFFLPDPAASLRRWVELLVPGGRLGVTTFGAPDQRWPRLDELFARYLSAEALRARRGRSRAPFDSDAGVERLLSDAGLVRVRTAHRTVRAVFRDVEHWLAFSWSHGQRAIWEAVPTDRHPALRAELSDELSQLADKNGALTMDQQVRYTLGQRSGQT
jgi:ubiquinone/menaquinone biosynthesis C-methylase UbiE